MLSPDDLTDIFESADMIGIHTFDMICLGICHIHLPLILHPYIIMPALKMPRRYLSNDNKDDDGVTSNEKRMFLTKSMDPMFKGICSKEMFGKMTKRQFLMIFSIVQKRTCCR